MPHAGTPTGAPSFTDSVDPQRRGVVRRPRTGKESTGASLSGPGERPGGSARHRPCRSGGAAIGPFAEPSRGGPADSAMGIVGPPL